MLFLHLVELDEEAGARVNVGRRLGELARHRRPVIVVCECQHRRILIISFVQNNLKSILW